MAATPLKDIIAPWRAMRQMLLVMTNAAASRGRADEAANRHENFIVA